MKRRIIGLAATMFMLAGTTLAALGVGTTAAQASVQPDFTCPGNTVCLFPTDSYTGNPKVIQPIDFSRWTSTDVVNAAGKTVHAGSVHDNTSWIAWVYSKASGNKACLNPVGNKKTVLGGGYGYIYVKVNVSSCAGQSIPQPLP
jgi:hypothetical protein